MAPPKFDMTISLGHLITALTLIVSVIGAYFAMVQSITANEYAIRQSASELKSEITRLEGENDLLSQEIGHQRALSDQRFDVVKADISAIRTILERLSRERRQSIPE